MLMGGPTAVAWALPERRQNAEKKRDGASAANHPTSGATRNACADFDAPARKVRPKSVGINLQIPAFIRISAGWPVNNDGTRV